MYTRPKYPVVIVDPTWDEASFASQRIRAIAEELQQLGYPTHATHDVDDGKALIEANPNLGCLLVAWDPSEPEEVRQLIRAARSHGEYLPVFLLADRTEVRDIDLLDRRTDRRVHLEAGGPGDVRRRPRLERDREVRQHPPAAVLRRDGPLRGGVRVLVAHARPLRRNGIPEVGGRPGVRALLRRAAVPIRPLRVGQRDGLASQAQRARSARPSGTRRSCSASDMTYFVTNGSSTSNRIVFQSAVIGGDSVVIDRNCHKSVEQAILPVGEHCRRTSCRTRTTTGSSARSRRTASGGRRSSSGSRTTRSSAGEPEAERGRAARRSRTRPTTASATTCGRSSPRSTAARRRIHFDEAWYAYARFNPMYEDRYAMAIHVDERRVADDLRHAVDAQAPGGPVAGVDDPRQVEPPGARGARPVQRGVHDAQLDLAAVRDHRLERRRRGDDVGRDGQAC